MDFYGILMIIVPDRQSRGDSEGWDHVQAIKTFQIELSGLFFIVDLDTCKNLGFGMVRII